MHFGFYLKGSRSINFLKDNSRAKLETWKRETNVQRNAGRKIIPLFSCVTIDGTLNNVEKYKCLFVPRKWCNCSVIPVGSHSWETVRWRLTCRVFIRECSWDHPMVGKWKKQECAEGDVAVRHSLRGSLSRS